MATKTYQVIVKEEVKWKVEVEATSHKKAQDLAIHEVAHNEWSHFPMDDKIYYSISYSCIKGKHNNGN